MPTNQNTVKLQAFMAHLGIASRRKSEDLIANGIVTVNGEPAHVGQRINPDKDKVAVRGEELQPNSQELIYVLVDKPEGYVSTTKDEQNRKTVLELLPAQIKNDHRLYPVGRLDIDSQGLLLITNDGKLAQKLTHPSFRHQKTYEVLVKGIPSTPALNHLKRGVKLKEGYTKPDHLDIIGHEAGNTWLEITIHQGMNRQIRRMMDRIGYPVLTLTRITFGPFNLDMLDQKPYLVLDKKDVSKLLDV